jgi:UDP-N-acetylglucosamine 4-epimerase
MKDVVKQDITGGAGFIGSNLCEYFLSKGHEVVCLDNFATGHKHNLKDFVNNPNFRLIEGDIRSTVDCQNAVKDVDYVPSGSFGLCSTFY